jgi:hypothetical protein
MRRFRDTAVRARAWVCDRVLLLVGAVLIAPLVAVDPAALVLLNAEMLMATGTAALMILRGDAALVMARIRHSHFVASCRAGVSMTREDPRSLLLA